MEETKWIHIEDYLPEWGGNYDCTSIEVPVMYVDRENDRLPPAMVFGYVDRDCGDAYWTVHNPTYKKYKVVAWLDNIPQYE